MARPRKKGLEYFTNDVNMYQDIKIRKLIHRKGIQAVAVYHILLCQIYMNGYYLINDEDLAFIISEIAGIEEDTAAEYIEACVNIGLFNRNMFDTCHILTSRSIQERFVMMHTLAKHKFSIDDKYSLLKEEEENTQCVVSTGKAGVSSEKTTVSTEETNEKKEETHHSSEETIIFSGKSTERKEKERKDNNSGELLSSTTTSTTRVHEASDGEETADGETVDVKVVTDELRNNREWLLSMQQRYGIDADAIAAWLNTFVVDCNCRGTNIHKDKSDVMRHFNDWLMFKLKPKRGEKEKGEKTPQRRWNSCQAELCQAVGEETARKSFGVVNFLRFDNDTSELHIQVPERSVYDFMEKHLVTVMKQIMPKYFGKNFQLRYHLPTTKDKQV